MMRLTFLRSPASRLPFAGVNTFYQALTQSGSVPRPIFYVSSSPWNLYDFLEEFMELNHIPLGTLFLRDFGLHTLKASHHDHKSTYIHQIMDTYPQLAFILIGDSGQHDPEVYSEIVTQRPQQVKAIYIRDVSTKESRDSEILHLAEQTREQHIDLCLVETTVEAAIHAVERGYIPASVLDQLKTDLAQTHSASLQIEDVIQDQAHEK
jgi:phosphatidate phosphatase APP1